MDPPEAACGMSEAATHAFGALGNRTHLVIERQGFRGRGARWLVPFTLHLGFDGWQRIEDRVAEPSAFGIWSVVLAESELLEAQELNFTRKYEWGWENRDQRVALERSEAVRSSFGQSRRTLSLLELA